MKTPPKRISTTSILLAFILIASFMAAILPQAVNPYPVYAATQQSFTTVVTVNWSVPSGVNSVTVLVVAGGGGGGSSDAGGRTGGGGGAGGLLYNASYPVTAGTNVSVTIGDGGAGALTSQNNGVNGSASVFGTITATGGGGGGSGRGATSGTPGLAGGSGGGGGSVANTGQNPYGGSGTTGQGKNGGYGVYSGGQNAGGGGGGNTTAGENGNVDGTGYGGDGGDGGNYSSIFGTSVGASGWFAGGGGGTGWSVKGSGGLGGGGDGNANGGGSIGTANTGGGGGGGGGQASSSGYKGGSGVVIIKYATLTTTNGTGGTVTTPGIGSYGYSIGKNVSIVATPDSCYNFVNWTGDTGTIGNVNSASTYIIMNDNCSIQANFAINTYTLTVDASPTAGGSPSGGGSYNCGTNASVVANTNSGYSFVNWTATAGASNITIADANATTTNVTVNGTGTVTANFEADAPADAYWVGGSGYWSDAANHWSTESGGDPSENNLPDETTNVHFDENSFSEDDNVVTIDGSFFAHDMDWTGSTSAPVLTWELGYLLSIYGDCTFTSGMTINSTSGDPVSGINFQGDSHLTSNGVSIGVSMFIGGLETVTSSLQLQDDLTMVGNVGESVFLVVPNLNCSFYTNDHDANITAIWVPEGNYVIDLGSSTINITSSFYTSSFVLGEGGTVNAEDSTIIMSSSGVFGGAGFTYGNVEFKGESLTVYGSNTYHDFSLASGVTQDVTFDYGTTQTMTMAYLSGSAGHIHTIHTIALIPATFVKSGGGTISSDYIDIAYINASPADTWCYGENSVEGDGCSGWITSCDINSAPTIGTIALWTTGGTPSEITSMNPQVEYNIKVPVTDNDTLNDLVTINATLYYDSEGNYSEGEVPTSGNTQTCAIITWTKSTNTLTISSGAGSSWAVNNSSSVFPSLSDTSGTFEFHFNPGKVATYTTGDAKWHIYAKATDSIALTGNGTKEKLTMNWYGEIAVNTSSVNWGSISPGTDFGDGTKQTGISVTYIANGAYAEQVTGSSPWTGDPPGSAAMNSSGSPSANQFSLKADDTATLGSAVLVNVSPSYSTIDNTGTITGESGDNVTANTLWLKLGTPFTTATYNGTVYWQIAQP